MELLNDSRVGDIDTIISESLHSLYTCDADIDSSVKPLTHYTGVYGFRFSYWPSGNFSSLKSLSSRNLHDAEQVVQQVIAKRGYPLFLLDDRVLPPLTRIRLSTVAVTVWFGELKLTLGYDKLPKTSRMLSILMGRWYKNHKLDAGLNQSAMCSWVSAYANSAVTSGMGIINAKGRAVNVLKSNTHMSGYTYTVLRRWMSAMKMGLSTINVMPYIIKNIRVYKKISADNRAMDTTVGYDKIPSNAPKIDHDVYADTVRHCLATSRLSNGVFLVADKENEILFTLMDVSGTPPEEIPHYSYF